MEQILFHLNYKLASGFENGQKLKLYVVNNPDGSPRWICNTKASKPLFLKFYAITGLRSKLFVTFFKLIYFFRIKQFFLKKITLYVEPLSKEEQPYIDISKGNWALFTGTVGPNNKYVVYIDSKQHGTSFYKIATTKQAQQLIKNEVSISNLIQEKQFTSFAIPSIIQQNERYVQFSDVSNELPRTMQLEERHIRVLNDMYSKTKHPLTWGQFNQHYQLQDQLNVLLNSEDERIPNGLKRKLNWLVQDLAESKVLVGLNHADFTPWNFFETPTSISIYDWELAKENLPLGFDLFHYIIQKGIQVEHKSWKEIKAELEKVIFENNLTWFAEQNYLIYLKWYLAYNCIYYLSTYSKQESWHVQVYWLIHTWNEVLSDLLQENKSHREMLIMDLFDLINADKYAALKFPDSAPEELSLDSDIDICIAEESYEKIRKFVENYIFCSSVHAVKKSFMGSFFIHLKDGSTLSLDIIWKFKRKHLVFLDADEVLNSKFKSDFGVKLLIKRDLSIYVGMFYGLNGQSVPEKYQYLKDQLAPEKSRMEAALLDVYDGKKKAKYELIKVLKKNDENRLFNYLTNLFAYFIDTYKQMRGQKGMIVTFSGVDGAGKSTIIEKVKYELEKKYRKRVVVIRHRPSILPILSAITKGKVHAEAKAANTLPRQGNNKNVISSLIRFSYYYMDYLFGQIIVNFKYKYRGIIVLYDRYYFDFILDGRRSNIQLSEKFIKRGYRFVVKPDFNFFLYADPEVILKRKQELSAETILELTHKYSHLFEGFAKRINPKKSAYILINNIELDQTMNKIFDEIKTKLN